MMTLALATVGPDACRARLVADPALDAAIARIAAVGKDGTRFEITRTDPIVGVTSVGVLASQVASICRTGGFPHGLNFV
jgi:aspartate dehydrogenase